MGVGSRAKTGCDCGHLWGGSSKTEGVRGFRYESEVVMVHKHVCTILEQGR